MAKNPSKVDAMRKTREASVALSQLSDRETYAQAIRRAASSTVESIIETGRLLINAKAALAHGEFIAMVADDLPFTKRTAQRFMAIASCARIANATHVSLLPPSWGTLYELSKLSDDEWQAIEPHLTPELERKDIKGLLPAPKPATPAVPSNWRADRAKRGAEILDSLPEAARETAAVIINEDAVPDEIGLRILETMGELDEAEQTECQWWGSSLRVSLTILQRLFRQVLELLDPRLLRVDLLPERRVAAPVRGRGPHVEL